MFKVRIIDYIFMMFDLYVDNFYNFDINYILKF